VRLGALLIALAVLFVIGYATGIADLTAERLRELLAATAAPAPVVFIALFLVLNTVGLPAPLLSATAGVAFGVVVGTAVALPAMMLTATVQFLFARHVGGDRLRRKLADRLGRVGTLLERRGIWAVATARLVGAPFSEFNIAAGLTTISARDFLLGTLLGGTPKVVIWTGLGAVLVGG
jgi:uncharacterized membrane protein YdjX (TVP38/TMEM64 family)